MPQDRVIVITGAAGGMCTVFLGCFLANGGTIIAPDTKEEALDNMY